MKNHDTSNIIAYTLTTVAIAFLIAFASYISFYVGEKYGIAITERKYQPKQ